MKKYKTIFIGLRTSNIELSTSNCELEPIGSIELQSN